MARRFTKDDVRELTGHARRMDRASGNNNYSNWAAAYYAKARRGHDGTFASKADRSAMRTVSRQLSRDVSRRGNDYRFGTKEEVKAQHDARLRDLRAAFGMAGG